MLVRCTPGGCPDKTGNMFGHIRQTHVSGCLPHHGGSPNLVDSNDGSRKVVTDDCPGAGALPGI